MAYFGNPRTEREQPIELDTPTQIELKAHAEKHGVRPCKYCGGYLWDAYGLGRHEYFNHQMPIENKIERLARESKSPRHKMTNAVRRASSFVRRRK